MPLLMNTLTETVTSCVVLTILCACAVAFPASTYNRMDRSGDLDTIIEELRKELHINDNTHDFSKNDLASFSSSQNLQKLKRGSANESPFEAFGSYSTGDLNKHSELFDDDSSAHFGAVKRQGLYDFDYGLGGGRFGKRGGKHGQKARRVPDYMSLGGMGGRFGRDVDHVSQMDNDFDDTTEYADDD